MAFVKLAKGFKEKRLSWKQIFQSFKPSDPQKNPNEIRLKDVKTLLKELKLGLTADDLDVIINSFEIDPINKMEIERKLLNSKEVIETEEEEKTFLTKSLLAEIQESLLKERVQLERLFFDFDEEQNGILTLAQFSNLISFLRIDANKQQIRIFFEKIDMDKKGYLTLPELKNFVEETITLKKQEEQDKEEFYLKTQNRREREKMKTFLEKIKQFLIDKRISLLKFVEKLGFSADQQMTVKGLEKILNNFGIILSKEELDFFLRRISQEKSINTLSFRDFLEFAVKERVEDLGNEMKNGLVHPTVAVCIGNITTILRKMEIGAEQLFHYFKRPKKNAIIKKDFLKLLQFLGTNFLTDDLQLLYQFFDEKGVGEILPKDFLDKFNMIASLHLSKLKEEDPMLSFEDSTSSRRLIFSTLMRISAILREKGFNRRQALGFFDRNGNSLLSREDFTESLHSLDTAIPLEEIRVLATFLDKNERNLIDLDKFLDYIEKEGTDSIDYVSEQGERSKGFAGKRAKEVLMRAIEELGGRIEETLEEMGRFERKIRPQEGWGGVWKIRGGIKMEEFIGVLRNNGVKLKEEEKRMIEERFGIRRNREFLDIEKM